MVSSLSLSLVIYRRSQSVREFTRSKCTTLVWPKISPEQGTIISVSDNYKNLQLTDPQRKVMMPSETACRRLSIYTTLLSYMKRVLTNATLQASSLEHLTLVVFMSSEPCTKKKNCFTAKALKYK